MEGDSHSTKLSLASSHMLWHTLPPMIINYYFFKEHWSEHKEVLVLEEVFPAALAEAVPRVILVSKEWE